MIKKTHLKKRVICEEEKKMNLKTNSIIVLILLNSIILSFARNMDLSKYGISERQRPKRVIDRFAINLIEYFNIDKVSFEWAFLFALR